jgi:hypothetical protein
MLKPDFTKYSLALVQGDKIIYSSDGSGLTPLWDCLEKYRQAEDNLSCLIKLSDLPQLNWFPTPE